MAHKFLRRSAVEARTGLSLVMAALVLVSLLLDGLKNGAEVVPLHGRRGM